MLVMIVIGLIFLRYYGIVNIGLEGILDIGIGIGLFLMPAHSAFHAVGAVTDNLNGTTGQIDAVDEHGKQKYQYQTGYSYVTFEHEGQVHSVAAAGNDE